MNRNIAVQAEAGDPYAARAGQGIHAFGIDLISGTDYPAPCVGAEGDSSRHGGAIERRQARLIARKRIRF